MVKSTSYWLEKGVGELKNDWFQAVPPALCDLGEVPEALWLYCPSADGGGGAKEH